MFGTNPIVGPPLKHSVYITVNHNNGKFYIGKHSSENPNDDYLGSGLALKRAIAKHGAGAFVKTILKTFKSEEKAYALERRLLEELDGLEDSDCYNLCYGGVGFWKGATHSKATRKKIAEANTGRKHTLESRAKMSVSALGKTFSQETRDKLSAALTGRKLSDEVKAKIRANSGMKGRTHTPEARAKITAANLGRVSPLRGSVKSLETRSKMSLAQRGRLVSLETRKKISKAAREKPSQLGTMWIHRGETEKKVPRETSAPKGWKLGRVKGRNHVWH